MYTFVYLFQPRNSMVGLAIYVDQSLEICAIFVSQHEVSPVKCRVMELLILFKDICGSIYVPTEGRV
jgi:hypothetical protein